MANSSGGVIRSVDAGFFTAPPKAHASLVYVVLYKDGHLRTFSGAPSATDRLSARFCYLVDLSEQSAVKTSQVTSAVDAYSFSVDLSATWQVSDPEAAVRVGLTDGSTMVLASLEDTIWQIARSYRPEQAAAAEQATRASLDRPSRLANGVTIVRAAAKFRADAAVAKAIADRDAAAHQAALERDRMAQLQSMFDGTEGGALMMHLLRHPDDTATVLGAIATGREKDQALQLAMIEGNRQQYLAMLDRALEHGLLNDADAQPLRDLLLGQAAATTLTGWVTMAPIAPRPARSLPAPGLPALGLPAGITAPGFGGVAGTGPVPGGLAAGSPVAQGYVVDDVYAPADDEDPDAPPGAPSPGSGRGGVVGWTPIKKPGQGS